jgi:signal transduction histidine kinase
VSAPLDPAALASRALLLGRPEELWDFLTRELRAAFSCADAAVFERSGGRLVRRAGADGPALEEAVSAPAEAGRPAPPAPRKVLALALAARGATIGAVALGGRPGGFSPEDAAALDRLGPTLAALALLSSSEERRERTERQLLRTERLVAISELVSGFAHEILNPLTVIAGFAGKLESSAESGEDRADLARISGNARRIEALTRGLQSLLRRSKPAPGPVDLGAAIDAALELAGLDPKFSSVRLVRDYAADAPRVVGDADALRRAFLNLIMNSVEAMPAGGSLRLRVGPGAGPGLVVAEIRDDGPGIASELLATSLDQLLAAKDASALGLGLAIVTEIVERHGGRVDAASAPERGTAFTLTFPAGAPGRPA